MLEEYKWLFSYSITTFYFYFINFIIASLVISSAAKTINAEAITKSQEVNGISVNDNILPIGVSSNKRRMAKEKPQNLSIVLLAENLNLNKLLPLFIEKAWNISQIPVTANAIVIAKE